MKMNELESKIVTLKKSGKINKEICNELGCSIGTVKKYCKKNNLQFLNKGRNRIDTTIILQAIQYYQTNGRDAAVKRFGLHRTTIKKYAKKLGIDLIHGNKNIKISGEKIKYSWRKEAKIKAVEFKGGQCQNCGYKKCIRALQFHHIDPSEKDFAISRVSFSWEKVASELKKCVMVCGNCHGEIHEELFTKGYSDIVNKIIENKRV